MESTNVTQPTSDTLLVALISNDLGSLDEWDHNEWRLFLLQTFKGIKIKTQGYRLNSKVVHTFTLNMTCALAENQEHSRQTLVDWKKGKGKDEAAIPPGVELQKLKIYEHPYTLFDRFLNADQKFNSELLYGDGSTLNQYLCKLSTQKYSIDNLKLKTLWYVMELCELKRVYQVAQLLIDSIKGFNLAKLMYCEGYKESNQSDVEVRNVIILQLSLPESTRHPDKAIKTIDRVIESKAKELSLKVLGRDAYTYFNAVSHANNTLKNKVGAGYIYNEYCKLAHVKSDQEEDDVEESADTTEQEEESSDTTSVEDSIQAQVAITSDQQKNFFAFYMNSTYSKQQTDAFTHELQQDISEPIQLYVFERIKPQQLFLCIAFDQATVCMRYNWFTDPSRKGYKLVTKHKLELVKLKQNSREALFKDHCIDNTIHGDPQPLSQYQAKQIALASNPQQQEVTRATILEQFHTGITTKKFKSVRQFRDLHSGNWKALDIISKTEKSMQDMAMQFISSEYQSLPTQKPLVTLRLFVRNNPLITGETPLTDAYLQSIGILELMNAVLKVIVIADTPKQGTIALYGVANSGKSSFAQLIDDIFICANYKDNNGNFDIIPDLKEFKFQIVINEEAPYKKLFNPSQLEHTKKFFERKGRAMERKGKQAEIMFEGAVNFFCSQYFDTDSMHPEDSKAIRTRCALVELTKSHGLNEKFPLNSRLVAEWLLRAFNQYVQLASNEEEKVSVNDALVQAQIPAKRLSRMIACETRKHLKVTSRDIENGAQTTIDALQNRYDTMQKHLKYYYGGKSFPYSLLAKIFMDSFKEREFCYTTIINQVEVWHRKQTLYAASDLKETFSKYAPYAIYSGAIYDKPVITYQSLKDEVPKATDLAFDIDMDVYDKERTCGCKGKMICRECWNDFIVPAVEIIDDFIRKTYKLLLWTFSGGRGVHLRVFDYDARVLSSQSREQLVNDLKAYAWANKFDLRLDEAVTKDLKRVLRLPFSIHGGSGKLVVPFNPDEVSKFDVDAVPSYEQAAANSELVDVYTRVLKDCYFKQYQASKTKYVGRVYKSEDRNPFITNNTMVEGSKYWDIWEKLNDGGELTQFKAQLFWFHVRTGLLEHQERLELMILMKTKGIDRSTVGRFFADATLAEKYKDPANKIKELVSWVFTKCN